MPTSVALAALDTGSERAGAKQMDLVLPQLKDRCLSTTPLLLAQRTEPLAERVSQLVFDPQGNARYGEVKLVFGVVPPVLPPSGRLTGIYQVLSPARAADGSLALSLRFRLRRGAEAVNETPPTMVRALTDAGASTVTNFFAIPYTRLAPGDYRIELVAEDQVSGCPSVAGADFHVAEVPRPAPGAP